MDLESDFEIYMKLLLKIVMVLLLIPNDSFGKDRAVNILSDYLLQNKAFSDNLSAIPDVAGQNHGDRSAAFFLMAGNIEWLIREGYGLTLRNSEDRILRTTILTWSHDNAEKYRNGSFNILVPSHGEFGQIYFMMHRDVYIARELCRQIREGNLDDDLNYESFKRIYLQAFLKSTEVAMTAYSRDLNEWVVKNKISIEKKRWDIELKYKDKIDDLSSDLEREVYNDFNKNAKILYDSLYIMGKASLAPSASHNRGTDK